MIRTKLFPAQETIGIEEKKAVNEVIDGGRLSHFRANCGESFYGGPKVQEFEKALENKFNIKHALAVNSCTSSLQIACGAIGLQKGDEVIVTPWSMSCSATAPMIYGATPVFADIEEDYFCLSYESVKAKITDKTKAIIVVDLFGQPFDVRIMELAEDKGIVVIEDAAQAIGSKYKDQHAGTIGHIGCFSFTQGKHLTCGEGGALVTNDKELYDKCALIRNHAEAVISDSYKNSGNLHQYAENKNMIGFNMRMGEIEASIMIEQLKKLDRFVSMRQENAKKINDGLSKIDFVEICKTRKDCTNSYYVLAFKYHGKEKTRKEYLELVKSELQGEENRIDKGVPIGSGYITPLYHMPLFHKDITTVNKMVNFQTVERLQYTELFLTTLHGLPLTDSDIEDIVEAFAKWA